MNLLELCKDSLQKANQIVIDLETILQNKDSKIEDLTNSNDSSNNIDTPDELSERK